VGESALEAALPWDRIPGVPYQAFRQPASMPTANLLAKDEAARGQKDADYRWLVSDIAAIEEIRKQKSLSLNLAERQAERSKLDADRLARENQRRAAQGKAPLKSLADPDPEESGGASAANAKGPDILLDQATQIMADIVQATVPVSAPAVVAKGATAAAAQPSSERRKSQ
jgi:carboxyl-terminal processing protease